MLHVSSVDHPAASRRRSEIKSTLPRTINGAIFLFMTERSESYEEHLNAAACRDRQSPVEGDKSPSICLVWCACVHKVERKLENKLCVCVYY